MVITLARCMCIFAFVQFFRPAARLMSDQAARVPREADGTIWRLWFGHITRIPTHFRLGGQAHNEFCLISAGDEIRDAHIYGV